MPNRFRLAEDDNFRHLSVMHLEVKLDYVINHPLSGVWWLQCLMSCLQVWLNNWLSLTF